MSTEKTEGAKKTCESCGTDVECHMSNYANNFQNKLQWQNADGTAHYKWIGPEKYECIKQQDDSTQTEAPKEAIQEPPSFPGVNVIPKKVIDYHNNAWEIALMKAKKVYEGKNATEVSMMILAQVFYKGLMGVQS